MTHKVAHARRLEDALVALLEEDLPRLEALLLTRRRVVEEEEVLRVGPESASLLSSKLEEIERAKMGRTHLSPYFCAIAALSSTALAVAAVPCSCPWTLVVSHTAPLPSLGMPSLNLWTAAHTSSSFCERARELWISEGLARSAKT